MRLFEKLTEDIKHNNLTSSYAESVLMDFESLKIRINKLKGNISTLAQTRRKKQASERQVITENMFRYLGYIEDMYFEYLYDLNDLYLLLKRNSEIRLTQKTRQKVELAINSRIQIRKEFENIYSTFKNMAKSFDDIPMKAILSKMRETFDFDSQKQKENHEYIDKHYHPKYYDANSGKIRDILQKEDKKFYTIFDY